MTIEVIFKAIIALPFIFYIPGYVIFNAMVKEKWENLEFSEVIFLQILGSVLVSGWIGLTLAEFGYFSLVNLLILLVIFSSILGWKYKVKFNLESFPMPKFDRMSLALIVVLLIAVGLFFHPYPWILGGRDPGVYVNTGVNIAKTGSIIIHDPLLASMDEATQELFYQIETRPEVLNESKYEGSQFLGFFITNKITGEITPQFLYLWTTWIAIFYSIFGLKISLYVTPFFAILSVLSVYFAGKTLFNKNVGLIAFLLLTLNFAQIWYARYPTTEVFTQFLIFSGIFTFIIFYRFTNKYFGLISALCFGETLLTRIDTIYLLVPVILFLGYLWLYDLLRTKHLYFIIPFVLLSIHAITTAVFISAPYTFDMFRGLFNASSLLINKPYLFLIGIISLIAFLILLCSYKSDIIIKLHQGKKFIPYTQHITAISIFVLIFYAYFIRPNGEIASDSYNLVKLSWYMSGFYGILLIGFSCILLLYKKPYSEIYFFLTIFFIYALFYITAARIYPDHPWWVRRYLPVVIPSAILCISYFLDWIKDLKIGKILIHNIFAVILLIIFLVPPVMADLKIVNHIEFNDAIDDIEKLSNIFEKNTTILYSLNYFTEYIGTPLYYIYGKEIRPVTISERSVEKSVNKIDELISSNKTVYLINIVNEDIKYANEGQFIKFYVNWQTFTHTNWKNYYNYIFIPENLQNQKYRYNIFILKNLSDMNILQILNGAWYELEYWNNIPRRWTSDNASIFISSRDTKYSHIFFKTQSFYKPRMLQVYLNNKLIHKQNISTGLVAVKIPIELKNGKNIIRFSSPDGCQRPIDIPELKNKDNRCLSFAFQNITIN